MEILFWYFIWPFVIIISFTVGVLSFFEKFRLKAYKVSKSEGLAYFILFYSRLFIVLSTLVYFSSLEECFQNKELGHLNIQDYFHNLFLTVDYFIGWVFFYWSIPIIAISLLMSSIGVLIKRTNWKVCLKQKDKNRSSI